MERNLQTEEDVVFLSLGTSPLANNFLKKEDLEKEEERFPLEVAFNKKTKLVHLTYAADPDKMFKHYVYVSSTTKTFRSHFKEMAESIHQKYNLSNDSLVADIGSNDGVLLKPFKELGINIIGIEPAVNIAKMANEAGVETLNEYFNTETAQKIIEQKGKADVITACNVFAHIPAIDEVTKGVKHLLKDNGVFVIEAQYFLDTMETMTFDNVYHEHLFFYTMTSLKNYFRAHDMKIVDVVRNSSHGGTIRVFVQKQEGTHEPSENVLKLLAEEQEKGIENEETYHEFAKKVYAVKDTVRTFIKNMKAEGKTIAGYGAPAKSTTLLNFLEIDHNEIDYIIDDNPLKQDLFTPGTHIPVKSSDILDQQRPDVVLILAWNFASEILEKTKKYADQGVQFIVPLPEPKVV